MLKNTIVQSCKKNVFEYELNSYFKRILSLELSCRMAGVYAVRSGSYANHTCA